MAVPFICSVCWLQWSSDVNDQTKRSAQNGKTLQWFYTTQMKCYMKQCNENTTIENNEIWDERSWRGRSWAQKNAFFKIGIPFFSARSRGRTGCAAKNNHIQSIGTSIGWLNIFDTIFQEIHLATQVERKQWRKRLSLSLSHTCKTKITRCIAAMQSALSYKSNHIPNRLWQNCPPKEKERTTKT